MISLSYAQQSSPAHSVVDTPALQQSESTSRPPLAATFRSRVQSKAFRSKPDCKRNVSRDLGSGKPRHIPRPPNSFILFRMDFVANRPRGRTAPGGKTLSKQAGEAWRLLPEFEKKKWAKKAHHASAEHARKNPNWKYQPVRKSDKPRKEPEQSQQERQSVVFHANTIPPVPFYGTVPPPSMIRRKESLRLHNWDDSVLSPTPHAAYQNNLYPNQYPESLRRRSSSVPIPESYYTDFAAPPSFGSQAHSIPSHLVSSSSMQQRLSYSGIRPGFMPLNIYAQPPQHEFFEDTALQPLPSQCDGPPPSFEGYRIVCEPRTASTIVPSVPSNQQPSETLYVSPFTQVNPNSGEVIHAPLILPAGPILDNISPRPIPHGPPPPMPPFNGSLDLSPMPLEHVSPPAYAGEMKHANLAKRLRSIDFGTPQASNPHQMGVPNDSLDDFKTSGDFFPLDIPLFEYFSQPTHQFTPNQSTGLEGVDSAAETAANSQDMERCLGLGLNCNFPAVEFNMFDEYLDTPFDEYLDTPGSGPSTCGSSPLSRPPLDLESTSAY